MEYAAGLDRPADQADGLGRSSGLFALAVGLILLAAAVRLGSLLSAPSPPADLSPVRSAASQWLQTTSPLPLDAEGSIAASSLDPQLVELGVQRIVVQRFDPTALVMIRAGADGQPGVAGVDDNGDGIVDNRSELGATRSDDECVVIAGEERIPSGEPTLVLQQGAFVPANDASPPPDSQRPARAVVSGKSGQNSWSFLVDFPNEAP